MPDDEIDEADPVAHPLQRQYLRLEVLRLAMDKTAYPTPIDDVIEAARKMVAFVDPPQGALANPEVER
jgi:hypothetical protein